MALTSSDVYSPQSPGLATVLGSGLNPLRILQQEEYRRQQQAHAAARLKQQQEAADTRGLSFAGDTKGWLPHNEELATMKKNAYAKMIAIGTDPTKSAIEKKALQQEAWDEVVSAADKSRQLNKAYTERLALASDKRYNKTALEKALYGAAFTTDENGIKQAKSIAETDAGVFDAVTGSRNVYNEDEVLKQFIKAESDKENERVGTAARPGGYGTTNTFVSDVFASKNGKQVFNADGSPAIRDINALIQRAHADPFMATILRDNAQRSQQEAGADAMTNYAQLTPEQNAALNGLRPTSTAERVDLADLVTQYGRVKTSSTQTYRAAPRPPAGTKEKNPPVYAAPVEADYVAPGQVENPGTQDGAAPLPYAANPTGSDTFRTLQAAQVPKGPQQVLATSKYSVPAPVHATASGQNKPYQTDVNGVVFRQALVQGEDGKYHWRTNIDKPTVGSFGDAVALPVNKATGVPLTPADGAAYEAAVRDPQNETRSFVQVITPKNKNFTAEYNQRLAQLKQQRQKQQDGDILGKGKYNTDAELADQAREDATGTTTITYVPNYGQDARTLDGLTQSGPQGNYRAHREGVAGHQQRVRAATPTKRADPLGFGAPRPAATSTAPKAKTIGKNNALGF